MVNNDIICIYSYEKFADVIWEAGQSLPDERYVHVRPTQLKTFFEECIESDRSYVVISTGCDYGLRLQAEHPVNADMENWVQMVLSNRRVEPLPDHYERMIFEERCVAENCAFGDKYSVKCAMHTINTFPEIPPNIVRLFITNTDVHDSRVVKMPYGMHHDKRDMMWDLMQERDSIQKKNRLYVNFSMYTMERANIASFYQHRSDDFLLYEQGLSWEDYAKRIRESRFTLCPEGNGIDSYRMMETYYLGSIPVVMQTKATDLMEIPKIHVPSYIGLKSESFAKIGDYNFVDTDWCKLSYWEQRIRYS